MVLSLDQDTIRLRAAWLTAAVDTKILTEVFEQFESIVLSLAAGGAVQSALDSTLTGTALRQIGLNSAPQVAEPGEFCTIDAGLLDVLRSLVADFLGVDSDLLSDTTSLISLGLDSIKSVGLARELQAQGHKVSPVELMNHSTLKRLAMLLVSDDRPDSNQYHGMNTLYDTTLRQLRSSVDVKPLKLSANDIIEIYPVTPLQAGMLSQVSTAPFAGITPCSRLVRQLDQTENCTYTRSLWFSLRMSNSRKYAPHGQPPSISFPS